MTKEEAIQIIDSLDPAVMIKTTASNKRIREAIDMAVGALSQPSLPSNLDEAANEEADDLLAYMKIDGDRIYLPTAKALMIALARFGAEWMAGQGETIECSVGWYDGPILDFSVEQLESAIMKAELDVGNKVIVQIRKK